MKANMRSIFKMPEPGGVPRIRVALLEAASDAIQDALSRMHIKRGFERAGWVPFSLDKALGNPLVLPPPQSAPATVPPIAPATPASEIRMFKPRINLKKLGPIRASGSPVVPVKPPLKKITVEEDDDDEEDEDSSGDDEDGIPTEAEAADLPIDEPDDSDLEEDDSSDENSNEDGDSEAEYHPRPRQACKGQKHAREGSCETSTPKKGRKAAPAAVPARRRGRPPKAKKEG
jgi:hypothetical protein